MKKLRIGTRGSALALWQANFVARHLQELGAETELVTIKTSGDRFQQAQLARIGLKGVFIKEIEDALLARRVDLAVHSMKDVPTEIPERLAFPAVCAREDVRDCLIARDGAGLRDLPAGARVGTGSLRRQAQLRHLRPELDFRDIRGNVDTRLAKLDRGEFDALVLARAGLERLGCAERITETLSTVVSLPAVGQGALGVEARAADAELITLLASLDDAETRAAVTAERALLDRLQGGCQVPLGAWGRIENGELVLEAAVLAPDGSERVRDTVRGAPAQAEALGRELAERLLEQGADRLLKLAGRAVGSD